jgi:2-dehydro-3-deoxyphosphogluconate aldolase / (4S)-4-hydroxy-2-oxoglutarate aldolase
MSHHHRLHIYNTMLETGLVPLFYESRFDVARQIIDACLAGGARVIEFTNRGDFAIHTFSELRRHYQDAEPDLMLGIGSVIDPATAALYIANGADFVVSPLLNPEVAKLCNRRKIPYLPGCVTPTEISQAEELGVEIVKLFPGNLVSPDYVKAIKAPMPWTRIMPTGGVDPTEASIRSWFEAGVSVVGIGSKLISSDRNYSAITEKCIETLGWIKRVKRDRAAG